MADERSLAMAGISQTALEGRRHDLKEVDDGGSTLTAQDFRFQSEITKVDRRLGLVLGWGVICKERGEEYFDVQADSATEEAMLEASLDFMEKSRAANDMHRSDRGTVVFAFPMTTEIAKAFGFDTGGRTGLMVGAKPPPDVLSKFESGEYTGFSIGGKVMPGGSEFVRTEVVESSSDGVGPF